MRSRLLSMLLCMALILSLSGCAAPPDPTESIETTAPAPTVPPDGDPADVTCKGTYYAENADGSAVAAMVGEHRLTNEQLQVYYWLEVAASRQENKAGLPDFTQSLDTQLVPLSSRVLTWQQHYLQLALNRWHAHQALVLASEEAVFPTEEAYKPDLEQRLQRMTGMPATKYLYAWNEGYTVNRLHQEYLDAIPQTLQDLAADHGFGSADTMADAVAGTDAGALAEYMALSNRAYMYFTEAGYRFEPTAGDVESYYQAHREEVPTNGEKTVTFRHILLLPDNAQLAEDGTVTAAEADWDRCLQQAGKVVSDWQQAIKKTRYANLAQGSIPEARFSEAAHRLSADTASRLTGGLYENIWRGQLAPELESWCFDDLRQHGDYAIIRSAAGCHIVFFSSSAWDWYTAAQAGLTWQFHEGLISDAMAAHPMEVDYSAIALDQVTYNGSFLTASDLLYPDIAHERFPDVPLYLQQDYPETKYGFYPLRTHGCGPTAMAMLASYMLDEPISPVMVGERYGYYCGRRGSEIVLCDDVPAELGFHVQKRSTDWDEISSALQNGQKVLNLQFVGYWTRGGHYILLDSMTEDGRYVVRDSNLFAYGKIKDHEIDSHTRGSIRSAGQYYWICEPKLVRNPACVRCAEDGMVTVPSAMLTDYHCPKCHTALARRTAFLAG